MTKQKVTQENLSDILKVEGINSMGYGIVPKSVMKDKRLPALSKLIYSYFCSYAGTGKTAFPSIKTICYDLGIKEPKTFRKYRKFLEIHGYIEVRQTPKIKGKFSRNIYILKNNPEPLETTNVDLVSPRVVSSPMDKNRHGQKPSRMKTPSNINSVININSDNNKSVSSSVTAKKEKSKKEEQTNELTNLFKQSQLELFNDKELQDNIKQAIKASYDDNKTQSIICKIKLKHVDEAIRRYRKAQEEEGKKIKNPKLYFRKCLLSAIEECGLDNIY